MSRLLVIVPSRGRPHNALDFIRAWHDSTVEADVLFALDDDDPTLADYMTALDAFEGPGDLIVEAMPRLGMCGSLNRAAVNVADLYDRVGFAGDDHRFRSPKWDSAITEALDALGSGIAYGNDLVHGEALPTAVFMTSDIVQALGYMAPPTLQHLFLDNFWKTLGEEVVAITYLPEVIIEHVHPIAQKAEWDEGYERVNAPEMYEHDRAAFEQWQSSQMALDVAKVRALRAVRA